MLVKNRFRENYVFLGLLLIIFVFGLYGLVKIPRKTSSVENRALAQFSHMTLKTFLNGSFQDNFENALSDQFIKSETIRVNYRRVLANMPTFGLNESLCSKHYIEVSNNEGENRRAFFNCEDYLVGYPLEINEETKQTIQEHIENYNRINCKIDTYYYYIENFFAFDFETNEREEYEELLKNNLVGERGIGTFTFDDYDDYKKYFYKTDHHWNYVGSYVGYSEIAEMLGIEKTLKPAGILTNHDLYYGTSSRLVQNYDGEEEFKYYEFDFPEHDVYIGGELSVYGHYDDYKNGNYIKNRTTNYYHLVYGDDAGEVIFDYHQKDRGNLLIISDSYGDPIKELLASHFNKTYAVDLRHYKDVAKKDFAFDEYVKGNGIDKVLFIMSPTFLTKEDRNQGLESVI